MRNRGKQENVVSRVGTAVWEDSLEQRARHAQLILTTLWRTTYTSSWMSRELSVCIANATEANEMYFTRLKIAARKLLFSASLKPWRYQGQCESSHMVFLLVKPMSSFALQETWRKLQRLWSRYLEPNIWGHPLARTHERFLHGWGGRMLGSIVCMN
jgi:hypothetical protein